MRKSDSTNEQQLDTSWSWLLVGSVTSLLTSLSFCRSVGWSGSYTSMLLSEQLLTPRLLSPEVKAYISWTWLPGSWAWTWKLTLVDPDSLALEKAVIRWSWPPGSWAQPAQPQCWPSGCRCLPAPKYKHYAFYSVRCELKTRFTRFFAKKRTI